MKIKVHWRYKKGEILFQGNKVKSKMYYVFFGTDMIFYTCFFGMCGNKKVSWVFDLLRHKSNELLITKSDEGKPLRIVHGVTRSETEGWIEQEISGYLYERLMSETK